MALREAVKRGRFVQNFSRFHQRWPENLHGFAILRDWPAALGGEAATYLSYFNGEQRGNALKDQIQGRLCSFRARICLRHMRRWEHPIPFQCCFPLRNKSKKKQKQIHTSPYLLTSPSRSWNERFYASAKLCSYLYASCFSLCCLKSMYWFQQCLALKEYQIALKVAEWSTEYLQVFHTGPPQSPLLMLFSLLEKEQSHSKM